MFSGSPLSTKKHILDKFSPAPLTRVSHSIIDDDAKVSFFMAAEARLRLCLSQSLLPASNTKNVSIEQQYKGLGKGCAK